MRAARSCHRRAPSPRLLLAPLLAASVACGQAGIARDASADAPAPERMTFARDVAPIVFAKCASCHRPGEAAPFSLLTFDDVRRHAHQIVDATARRIMPPWLPAPGEVRFAGERRLTDGEIETIRRWVEQGAARGDADAPVVPLRPADEWTLGKPDVVLQLPQPYILAADTGEVWRNFVIPIPLTHARYVRTVELHPGNRRVVHHALMAVDASGASRRRDRQDAAPGFPGMDMGDAQAPDGHLLGWTPGMAPFPGIDGQAWRVEPGTDLVLQLHLRPSGKIETVSPRIGVYFAQAPPTGPPMYLLRLDADHALDIPPGARAFTVEDAFELPVAVTLLAAYPHAHFLANSVETVAVLPDGRERTLLRIEEWNFNWQDVYRYATPVPLPKHTRLRMRYTYDNSAENPRNPNRPPRRVVAGLRSVDEMAHLQFQLLTAGAADLLLLKHAFYQHVLEWNPKDAWVHYELANTLRDQGRVEDAVGEYRVSIACDPRLAPARNNLGDLLQRRGDLAAAIVEYRAALGAEPDFVDAHYNLANALRLMGDLGAAAREYREALRLQPGFAAAHNNLGEIFATANRIAEAVAEFREAVRLDDASAAAHDNLGVALGSAGMFDEAIQHFRRALALDPSSSRARRNLEIALERRSGTPQDEAHERR